MIFFKKSPLSYSLIAALLMVLVEVEPWAMVLSLILLFARWGAEKKWWPFLPKIWINFLSIAALGLVLAQFKTFLGQEASSTLLVLLCTLRIADFKTERDQKSLILLGFVLVALKFLFTLDLYWLPIGGLIFLGLWRALLPSDMEAPWKVIFLEALKSFPIVVLLFFAFPRVQVPWLRNAPTPIPLSGFSESISPGDIADLTLSRETVFRAKFLNYRPSARDLYWRGAVLEEADGFTWNKTKEPVFETQSPRQELSPDYMITLEPSSTRVLPTYEYTRFISSPIITAYKSDRAVYKTHERILSRIQYTGSISDSWSGPTTHEPLQLHELPPKTKAWVQALQKKKLSFQEKLQTLKSFFANGGFAYTRQPGAYENMDEFLFGRKLGFCEHFAGAYATLARALGIPARVITGYQGGEWNDTGEFYRITQADAHAWVEVRNPTGMWFRVDPTYWIAPLRIELGGLQYFQLTPQDLKQGMGYAMDKLHGQNLIANLISTAQFQIDNLNYLWTRALLEFDLVEQQKLLKLLAPRIGWWISFIAFIVLMYFTLNKVFKYKRETDQATETFLWLQNQFEKKGFYRNESEPPIEYLEKRKQDFPKDIVLLNKTIQLYRYEKYRERKSGPDDWSRLRRAWKYTLTNQAK